MLLLEAFNDVWEDKNDDREIWDIDDWDADWNCWFWLRKFWFNFDLMHLRVLSMTDSLIHYLLTHMINYYSSNVIFASTFDSIKPENNENLETTIWVRFEFECFVKSENIAKSESFVKTEEFEIEHLEMILLVNASMQ